MIPESIRPLLDLVGPSFFKALPWRDFTAKGTLLLKHLSNSDLNQKKLVIEDLKKMLAGRNIELSSDLQSINLPQDPELKKQMGEKILEFYFLQFQNSKGLFLDLRSNHFKIDGNVLTFEQSKLWVLLDEHFRLSLLDLYKGYYQNRTDIFDKGLKGVGLINSEMNLEQVAKIKGLFIDHFGPGDQTEVRFTTAHFVKTFENIFRFILDQKLQISAQFLFLGIYLASLYKTLDSLGVPLDARKSYLVAAGDSKVG
jgi:hypothetical protein